MLTRAAMTEGDRKTQYESAETLKKQNDAMLRKLREEGDQLRRQLAEAKLVRRMPPRQAVHARLRQATIAARATPLQ